MERLLDHLSQRIAGTACFLTLVAVAVLSWSVSSVVWPGLLILLLAVVYGFAVATGGPFFENLIVTAKRLAPVLQSIATPTIHPTTVPIITQAGPPPPSDADRAGDPATAPEVLMDLAANRPDLRPAIAKNPAAYPALIEWLAGLNDPATNEALNRRPV